MINQTNRTLRTFFNEFKEDKEMANFTFLLYIVVIGALLFFYRTFSNRLNTNLASISGIFLFMSIMYVTFYFIDRHQDLGNWKGSVAGVVGFGTKKNAFYGLIIGILIGGSLILGQFINPDSMFSSSFKDATLYTFILVGIIIPLTEESFFRGFLMPTLSKMLNPLVAILFVSGLFAIMHLVIFETGAQALMGHFIFSVLMILVLYTTKSLSSCVVAHAIINLSFLLSGVGLI